MASKDQTGQDVTLNWVVFTYMSTTNLALATEINSQNKL